MGKDELKRAYQRLEVEEYTGLVKETCIPFFDTYDGEFITMLWPETIFQIKPAYYGGKLLGWNIYANGELLETKSTQKKARKFLLKACSY